MAILSPDAERERRASGRHCGECSLCCVVLRVDELAKPAGRSCVHQSATPSAQGGCTIHADRPPVCRAYRCLWLQGGLEEDERPDRLGALVDLEQAGMSVRLAIREVRRGQFDESPALRRIAERYRSSVPVRISDVENVLDPDGPFRVLLADGVEHRVAGDWTEVWQHGELAERRRMPWAERLGRRVAGWWRSRGLGRPVAPSG